MCKACQRIRSAAFAVIKTVIPSTRRDDTLQRDKNNNEINGVGEKSHATR